MGQLDVMVLLHNLTQLLAQERNKLPDGMEDQLRWYYNQFELMLGFLTYTERWYDKGGLPSEIAEVAYRTEEVVDTHYRGYKMVDQDQLPFVPKMDHTGNLKKDIEGMIERVGGIMSTGSNSSNSKFQYDSTREKAVQMLNQSLLRTTRGWVADPEVDLIVDNKRDCDMLVDRLIKGGPPEELDFVAIEGGIDMINLVKKVYNDASVRDHFDSRAWVLLPEEPNMRNLLLSILNDIMVIIPREIHEMEVWELKKLLLKQLNGIRYLIVLQYCRFSLTNYRDLITDVLPKSKNGSRITVTTDNYSKAKAFVGESSDDPFYINIPYDGHDPSSSKSRECRLFRVRYLGTEDYWKVFCKKIFGEKECPKELEDLGRKIVESCRHWQSIILKTACILRVGEKTVSRWSNVAAQIEGQFYDGPKEVLIKCYDEMPQHLKTCFLYLSVFPRDHEISVKQLIQLWIAEGLIQWVEEDSTNNNTTNKQHKQARRIEDVAEKDYLEGLIGLNFIDVTNTRLDGGPKSCRIRPSEWSFYIHISSGEKFVHFFPCTYSKGYKKNWNGQPRRLSIGKRCASLLSFVHPESDASSFEDLTDGMIKDIDVKQQSSNIDDLDFDSDEKSYIIKSKLESKIRFLFCRIHTLSCFDQDTKNISEETWELLFEYTRLLRVLNIEAVEVGKLPKAMEKLFHLRYLSVKPQKNIAVPKSIFNLWNLQTIDLRTTQFSELPKGIWKMQQLRHLYLSGDGPSSLPIPESKYCTLPNLQTLSFISIDPDDGIHLSERTPNLRKLGLCGYQCFSISEEQVTFDLPHLQTLKFAGECNFEVPITLPDTITKISTTKGVYLQQNVTEMFGKLPNLQVLKLVQTSFDDGELVFGEGSFPQLQLLKFEASNIVTWRLEDETMPNLHRLIINNCSQLTELPTELWKVNTLHELDLSRASMEFAKKVDDHLKGKEGSKIVVTFPLSSKSGA